MSAFFVSFVQTAFKFLILAGLAVVGIISGKKFRDKKNQEK